MVHGKLQIEGEAIQVIVKRCFDLTSLLRSMDREETMVSRQSLSPDPMKGPRPTPATEMHQKKMFQQPQPFREAGLLSNDQLHRIVEIPITPQQE
ncbi:hypothetical protein J7E50_08805 [Pedobacter sp. ISL-68]|uniref:hypothetical protein n=1 Tax=unclassified Pedobacter TaxID=2628915 RepID=UPI001BE5617B|nr:MULTISPECIES: hypothetical protein [unclassified Pedobacter]MBT2560924.1 hypothetical protein [Pedobacter sp. ISL-64]MBT2590314.1 hypothetical protein [Pedobacter sp. ISL-68]